MLDLREAKEFIKDSLGLIATVVAVFLIIIYVATIQQVVGPSMNSTLKDGDIMILNKLGYRIFDVKRFDVVSLRKSNWASWRKDRIHR